MEKVLLLGDEAIAQGAIDAGLSGVYSYPGTPSTEITEYIQESKAAQDRTIHSKWCANEKTAVECAVGMSYAGKRALSCMKHVGVNVAADPILNVSMTGANGGYMIVTADDPSMHSSQNEQDSRFYGKFAFLPILEPSTQQECYDMTRYAYDLSEKFSIPVMLRITTRLAHSRAGVTTREARKQNEIKLPANPKQFVLLPAHARGFYLELLEKQKGLEAEAETSGFNKYIDGKDKSMGIIATGIDYNYLMENYTDGVCPYPVIKIGQYPLPKTMIERMFKECETIMVIEEGMPIVEEMLRGYLNSSSRPIKGRLDGTLPRVGELNPNKVAKALGMADTTGESVPAVVAPRPPALCKGCPHIDSYNALNEAIKPYGVGRVFSDIGCYTLGFLPPYHAINTTLDMGASIPMAKGAADAGLKPAVAVLGDSTFTHSGMTGLLDCVVTGTPVTVMILDNSTTGMTGGQDSHAVGRLISICKGLGVEEDHIRVLSPLPNKHAENTKIIAEELAYDGISVIIPQRECLQTIGKKKK